MTMIGILCDESERDIVREFFELFKTPWEFCIPGRCYPVVISTLNQVPGVNAKLLIIFSSEPTEFDDLWGISVESAVSEHLIGRGGVRLPIYGKLSRLCGRGEPMLYGQIHSETVVVGLSEPNGKTMRVGYDLFREAAFLLSEGQPVENALVPTLEAHISLLRAWTIEAGIPVVEIPPIPWGHSFIACLTHDVDFVGIRRHKLDHTFWGFAFRALVGSLMGFARGRGSLTRLVKNWVAVSSLPFVYLGLVADFWDQFAGYAEIDRDFSSTFFLIPFKDRAGAIVSDRSSDRRVALYDIRDVHRQIAMLTERGYEIGLHGIDAWHCPKKGEHELKRIVEVTGQERVGVRMHWLCFERQSPTVLEQAGFDYDSTFGYNETVGYKVGTTQAFQPLGVTRLLELPLHIQDTALFLPRRMALTDAQAWDLCMTIVAAAARYGGIVTVLWHMRSLAPERLWGEFYVRLLQELRTRGAWFGTAGQVVQWFRQRRSVLFEESRFTEDTLRLRLGRKGGGFEPRLFLRVHRPQRAGSMGAYAQQTHLDVPWTGQPSVEISLD
jgi:peptidoglycan/xylan/chitin deacetylase (PgdA/CDA1 family)